MSQAHMDYWLGHCLIDKSLIGKIDNDKLSYASDGNLDTSTCTGMPTWLK